MFGSGPAGTTMPTKQLRRSGQTAAGVSDKSFYQRDPDTVDRLAFKYMEMCKVDSSSDSESDTSPRGSDVSSKGSTGPRRPPLPQRSLGRHYQQPLDPYDGSSEDSASSADGPKRHKLGAFRLKGRGRRTAVPSFELRRPGQRDALPVLHFEDIHMRSSSDSELKVVNHVDFQYSPRKCTSAIMTDKPHFPSTVSFCTETSFNPTGRLLKNLTILGTLSKRKLVSSLGEGEEYLYKKKQCITQTETE